MFAYEIYEVPNDELDGTEEYIDESVALSKAKEIVENIQYKYTSTLWIILCSDEKGYEKVVQT